MIGRFQKGDKIFIGRVDNETVTFNQEAYTLSQVKILPPCSPSKIVCVGLNYTDHARELDYPIPETPILFIKPSTSIIGHGANIVYPKISSHLDYEGEMAVIIGKRCKNVKNPQKVILGYTCFNDVTARDIQIRDVQWTRAKSFDTFAPLGPFVSDAIDPHDTSIQTRINGKIKQKSNTTNLIFDVNYLVTFVSEVMTLEAGDVIATGTPYGVGALLPGDTVEVEIDGVGILANQVVEQEQN